jgi:hypothetical protein
MDTPDTDLPPRPLWRAWLLGGLIWSVLFLGVAATVMWLFGIEGVATVQAALTMALVTFGGFYVFVYLVTIAAGIVRRLTGRGPE